MIGLHEIHVYWFILETGGAWFTSRELVTKTRMAPRTARKHLHRLTALGVLERRTAFGGSRYRRAPEPDPRARDYLQQLESIGETFEKKPGIIGSTFAALSGLLGGAALSAR